MLPSWAICTHVPSWVCFGTYVRPVGLIHMCGPVGYGIYYIFIYIVHMLPSWVWYSTHAAQLGHLHVLPIGLYGTKWSMWFSSDAMLL